MGILVFLAAAVCGRTPLMGLLLPENRFASHIVELNDLDVTDWTMTHYHCLGYTIGDQVPGFKPVMVNGLPPELPFDYARALVISMPTSGAVTLAHIVGTSPEAPTAIICIESEPVLSGAVITTGIPAVDRPEKNVLELIKTGDHVRVDADAGIIEIKCKRRF